MCRCARDDWLTRLRDALLPRLGRPAADQRRLHLAAGADARRHQLPSHERRASRLPALDGRRPDARAHPHVRQSAAQ